MAFDDVNKKSVGAVKWVYLQTAFPKLLRPLTTVILARLLAPSVYGLVAIASTTIALLDILRDMGMSRALIQSDENEDHVFNIVFWSNLVFGLVLYGMLLVSAPWIAGFFHQPSAVPVLRVLGFQLIVASLGAVHRNILVRRIEFDKLFVVDLLPNLIPLFVTIPLAYIGWGVWSLVVGSLAASIVQTALLWWRTSWRPKFQYDFGLGRQLLVFGFLCALEALMGWFYVYGDNAIVGHYLDVSDLGLYTVSYNLVVMILGTLLAPVSSITFPAFSRLQHNMPELRDRLLDLVRISALISLPIGVGIALIARPATSLIYGGKWIGLDVPLSILAIQQGLSWVVAANPEVYKAVGRADIMPKFQALKLLYTIPIYVLGAQQNLVVFCYAKLVVVLIGMPLHLLLAVKFLHIDYRTLFAYLRVPFLAAAGMAVVVGFTQYMLRPLSGSVDWVELLVLSLVGVASYGLMLYILDVTMVRRMVHLGRSILAQPQA
ncbi:MAG: lipopolysaccharide biosynthesis protein [Thermoflexales bacterium]|nr:lipopolysaccharide biosynthesis protein [Thermoflexales bacterium]